MKNNNRASKRPNGLGQVFSEGLLHFSLDGGSVFAPLETRIYRLDVPDGSVNLMDQVSFKKDIVLAVSPADPVIVAGRFGLDLIDQITGNTLKKLGDFSKVRKGEGMADGHVDLPLLVAWSVMP